LKAITNAKYGSPDVLELKEVVKPVPKEDEVLIRVHAASANAGDWHILRGSPFIMRLVGFGLFKPKYTILGTDVAGTIESVGNSVKQFKVGDEVYGDLSLNGYGGYAEYVCTRENSIVLKPANISFEEAAAVPTAAVTALQGLRDHGKIEAGQKVLVNGASGGIGTFAVQLAKAFGAEVTAVCSTKNLEIVRSIGADHTVDYTKENFTKSGKQYDLILAPNGYHPISDYKRALTDNGRYVMTGGATKQMFEAMLLGPWISMTGNKKMSNSLIKPNQKDLEFLKGLLEAGKVKPVIVKRYKLSEVAEAVRYVESGHAQGKVVINVL